ncbi:hypothetical protein DXG01_016718 [Tephrocybe rancida]|nr:hypothetical protein DXG01_016718 [Tephrocybe rancida]
MASPPPLFQAITVGTLTLSHRVVLAPLTRFRANSANVPVLPLVKEYYSQRSTTPGTFVITEGTQIAPIALGTRNDPGIWTEEQTRAWKEITDAVHANGSYIYVQLCVYGRNADSSFLASREPPIPFVAPSPIPLKNRDGPPPRELTTTEVREFVQLYVQAATNAVEKAGFDGVEIHSGNGYFLDTFLQESSNQRTDEYGGSIERRSRLGLEIVDAVARAIGASRTGVRLTPWNTFQDMGQTDPVPQFSHFVSNLKANQPQLAYLHLVEPRISGDKEHDPGTRHESNDFLRAIWSPLPLIVAGGFTRATALVEAEEHQTELISFGRLYLANPDLPWRLRNNVALAAYDRSTFYGPVGDESGAGNGYTDYPSWYIG